MGTSPSPAITIPDSEVIRDEDVVRDQSAPKPGILKRINDWWTTPQKGDPDPYAVAKLGSAPPITESPRSAVSDTVKLGMGAAAPGLIGAPALATGLGLAGGLVGGYGGSKLGGYLGNKVDAPELGEDIGGLTGAVLGGGVGGRLGMRSPTVEPIAKGPFSKVTESPVPGGYKGPPRLGSKPAPPSPFPTATSTATPVGSAELPSVPQGSPTPFPTVQPATPRLGPQPDPQWFPEPRAETPIDRPGSMWSVERPTLPTRALRGQPGALDVLTNVGDRPPLVTPKPTVGVADPEFNALQGRQSLFGTAEPPSATPTEIASPAQPESQGGGIPQGNQTPFGQNRRALGPSTPPLGGERRAGVADWQRAIETTPPGQPTPGEQLESTMRQSGAPSSSTSEGEARNYMMRQPGMWEKFKAATEPEQRQMLIDAKRAIEVVQ